MVCYKTHKDPRVTTALEQSIIVVTIKTYYLLNISNVQIIIVTHSTLAYPIYLSV